MPKRTRKSPQWTVPLSELGFVFLRVNEDGTWRRDVPLAEAQGCSFTCPVCMRKDGAVGAHGIVCWFRNPPDGKPVGDELPPGPGRWWLEGTGVADLTFNYGEPRMAKSVLMLGGCKAHFYVDKGRCVDADH